MQRFFLVCAMVAMLGIGIAIGCFFTRAAKADAPASQIGRFQTHLIPAGANGVTGGFIVIDTATGTGYQYQFNTARPTIYFQN